MTGELQEINNKKKRVSEKRGKRGVDDYGERRDARRQRTKGRESKKDKYEVK